MIDPTFVGGPGSPRPVTPTPTGTGVVAPRNGPPAWFWPLVVVCIVTVTTALVGSVLWERLRPPTPVPPSPVADYDPAFVPVGKQLAKQFGADFGAALEDGAKLLDAGQARKTADDTIREAFIENRKRSFDSIASPALEAVVSKKKAEAEVTDEDKKKLARVYRGMRKGAEGR